MPDWKTLSSEVVYETAWIKVFKDEVLNQNSQPLTYSYVKVQNASVFVVALNDNNEALLQQVFRYTIGKRFWEIPAGYTNPDEDPIAGGKRELQEETGYTSDDWQYLGCIYQVLGVGNVPCHIVLARNVTKTGDFTDKDEDIENRTFKNLDEIEQMITDNMLIDSPVITALYKAKLHIQKED
jgi:ADP-ribose pyrophosphatase